MIPSKALAALLVVLTIGTAAADDAAEGEKLYRSQCQMCHGRIDNDAKAAWPLPVRVAMGNARSSVVDFAPGLGMDTLAFAPPFGPNLRGVVGRIAGTAAGFSYSPTFMKTLKGMEWNEAALNVWITSPQAWVPGVYMFYKQPDPEIRQKIIAYLKANP